MDKNTLNYLKGRFKDYYRTKKIKFPPKSQNREWGYIPWDSDRMLRHKTLNEIKTENTFNTKFSPKHVYFSASQYKDPGAKNMDLKKWVGSDLIFDLDADHLPSVDEEDNFNTTLSKCKDSFINLIKILKNDFNFNNITIIFSGRRGYHAHIRNNEVQEMRSDERIEIANYIQSHIEEDIENLMKNTHFRKEKYKEYKLIYNNNIISSKFHKFLINILKEYDSKNLKKFKQEYNITDEDDEIIEELNNLQKEKHLLKLGFIKENKYQKLLNKFFNIYKEKRKVKIDQPVTTDTNRLIRLPGSLHGGSGLKVTRISSFKELKEFNPLENAIPEKFKQTNIKIKTTEETNFRMNNEKYNFKPNEKIKVPEYVGIFLMSRDKAILD